MNVLVFPFQGSPAVQFVDVHLGTNQTVTANTWTKVELDTEASDADGVFDPTTNHRFTPTVAGFYLCIASVSATVSDGGTGGAAIALNGNRVRLQTFVSGALDNAIPTVTAFLELNGSTDFVEVQGFSSNGSTPRFNAGSAQTYFMARRVL